MVICISAEIFGCDVTGERENSHPATSTEPNVITFFYALDFFVFLLFDDFFGGWFLGMMLLERKYRSKDRLSTPVFLAPVAGSNCLTAWRSSASNAASKSLLVCNGIRKIPYL